MRSLTSLLALSFTAFATGVFAQDGIQGLETIGKPTPRGISFQEPTTELMRDIIFLDNLLLVIITVISVFVTALLAYACWKFAQNRNKTPASFTHHSALEVTWTVVPVLILVFIGAFSLPVLFKQQTIPQADLTIKATGYQWYWGYEYVDDGVAFDSIMLEKEQLAEFGYAPDEYLLATDTAVVIPVNKTVVVQVTGADVIHAWTIPSFGVKQDGVPGRVAELWFKAEKEGVYFGQCSELCGLKHAYMPITVKVVSEAQYAEWLARAKEEFAAAPADVNPVVLASDDRNLATQILR